jgi:hypothetical protein
MPIGHNADLIAGFMFGLYVYLRSRIFSNQHRRKPWDAFSSRDTRRDGTGNLGPNFGGNGYAVDHLCCHNPSLAGMCLLSIYYTHTGRTYLAEITRLHFCWLLASGKKKGLQKYEPETY